MSNLTSHGHVLKRHYHSDCEHNQKNYRPQVGLGTTTCKTCLRTVIKDTNDPTTRAVARLQLDSIRNEEYIVNMERRLKRNKKLSLQPTAFIGD